MLAEFGFAIPQGIRQVTRRAEEIISDAGDALPGSFRDLIRRLTAHFRELDQQVGELDEEILQWHRQDAESQRLASIPGVGPLTATALSASIGDARNFKNGRQRAAWLGLVPRQHSSGGKPTLLGISKRGDTYLRTLLVHGARAVIRVNEHKAYANPWLQGMLGRRHKNVVIVALANKNARIAWTLLRHETHYEPGYGRQPQAA